MGMNTYLNGPMYYAKRLLHFRAGDLDLPGRKREIPVVEWRRKKAHRAALVATQTRVEATRCANVNCTGGDGMC